ncbi:MAG TPA: ABC transporter ATP-binding protein [Dehalococcoidales bacterium]|nr:ABC transporter ATP-binding protein [Dehalococcoidales bacterium]
MLLEINQLCKVYRGGVKANDNINLSVREGEVFGLLGPNGAGKTTVVNQIIGLTVPTSGSISIAGIDVVAKPSYARQACSFQAQTQVPIAGLTAIQAIELVGRIRGGSATQVRQRANELVDHLEIGEWKNKMGITFSGGVRRLVAFCMAAVMPGSIVILDEPTNDIDPLRRRLLWREVHNLAERGSAVLLVTHNVLEAERVVNRLAIINDGRVIGQGTPATLKESEGESLRLELILEPDAEPPQPADFLIQSLISNRRMITRVGKDNITTAIEWARNLKEEGIVEEFSLGPTTLEDTYVRMVGRLDTLELPEGGI